MNLEDVKKRHLAWYNTGQGYDGTAEAEWPDDLDFVESYELDGKSSRRERAMAHEIVREDVPTLIAALEAVEAWCSGQCVVNDDGAWGDVDKLRAAIAKAIET